MINILRQRTLDLAPLDQVGWLSEQPAEFRRWASTVGNWQDYGAGQTFILQAIRLMGSTDWPQVRSS